MRSKLTSDEDDRVVRSISRFSSSFDRECRSVFLSLFWNAKRTEEDRNDGRRLELNLDHWRD